MTQAQFLICESCTHYTSGGCSRGLSLPERGTLCVKWVSPPLPITKPLALWLKFRNWWWGS